MIIQDLPVVVQGPDLVPTGRWSFLPEGIELDVSFVVIHLRKHVKQL